MKLLTEVCDERSTWETPGRKSIAGVRKGRDSVFSQFGRYGGETATQLHHYRGHDPFGQGHRNGQLNAK